MYSQNVIDSSPFRISLLIDLNINSIVNFVLVSYSSTIMDVSGRMQCLLSGFLSRCPSGEPLTTLNSDITKTCWLSLSVAQLTSPLAQALHRCRAGLGFHDGLLPLRAETPSAKANVNSSDQHGNTALSLAARHGATSVVKALLSAKANVKAKDKQGKTALYWALQFGDEACVKVLRAAGAKE